MGALIYLFIVGLFVVVVFAYITSETPDESDADVESADTINDCGLSEGIRPKLLILATIVRAYEKANFELHNCGLQPFDFKEVEERLSSMNYLASELRREFTDIAASEGNSRSNVAVINYTDKLVNCIDALQTLSKNLASAADGVAYSPLSYWKDRRRLRRAEEVRLTFTRPLLEYFD